MAGGGDKRTMAKANYDALYEFIASTVDNLHTQSPWLLQPPKTTQGWRLPKGDKPRVANLNAFMGASQGGSTAPQTDEQRKRMKEK